MGVLFLAVEEEHPVDDAVLDMGADEAGGVSEVCFDYAVEVNDELLLFLFDDDEVIDKVRDHISRAIRQKANVPSQ